MDNFNKKTFVKRFPRKALKFLLIMVLISGWLYSGWPQINFEYKDFSFTYPAKPQIAHAAVPTFQAAGNLSNSTKTISPAMPGAGLVITDDILLLACETANEAVTVSGGTETWAEVLNSPQGTGTAGGIAATRLTVFWARASQDDPTSPTTNDPGNHVICRITTYRGVITSGDPWDVTAGGVEATPVTSNSIPGNTTTVTDTLVVAIITASLPDAVSTNEWSSFTNSNLTSVTERTDNTNNKGNGGALGIATGIRAAIGNYGATTVTSVETSEKGMISIALRPPAAATTFEQRAYGWFSNADSSIPGSILAAQDTTSTLSVAGSKFRLRLLILIGSSNLAINGENFKLQLAGKGGGTCTSPSFTYADVATTTAIAFFQNSHASTTDASLLGPHVEDPTDGGAAIINQDYKEYRDFTNSEAGINTTEDGKWDFSLYDNNATSSSTFCFRVVKSDDTALDTYNIYPALIVASAATGGAGGSSDPSGGGTPTTGGGEGGDDATESGSGGGTPTSGGGEGGGDGASPTLLDLLNELIWW